MGVVGESAFFMGAAVIVFLFAVVTEIRSVQQYQRSECKVTQAAINYLEEVEKNSPKVTLKREQIHQKLGEKLGGKVWDWLKEHLAGRLDSTGEAYQTQLQDNHCMILHYPSVLARSVPRSSLSFIPALLTAIGLLGTFYGIQTGLSKFDLGAIADAKNLLAASTQVLGGMKTAFSTSLVGLGSASIFMLVLAWGSWARKKHREHLRSKLDKIAVLCSAEDAQQRATLALIDAAKTMKTLTPQAIGQEVGAALTPVFKQIRQELSTLREIKADQGQEVLKHLIQDLRTNVLQPVAERLDLSAES